MTVSASRMLAIKAFTLASGSGGVFGSGTLGTSLASDCAKRAAVVLAAGTVHLELVPERIERGVVLGSDLASDCGAGLASDCGEGTVVVVGVVGSGACTTNLIDDGAVGDVAIELAVG